MPATTPTPMPVKRRRTTRLPRAPLAEAVFEMRWKLPGPPEAPAILKSDPGLILLIEKFTARMKKLGFGHFTDMSPPFQTAGYGIARRYFKKATMPFPIMQVGHGIFATNESALYEWSVFKKQVRTGLLALLESYPKLGIIVLEPCYLELRYIDAFDKSLLGKAAVFDFLKRGTTLEINPPDILNDAQRFAGDAEGRFIFSRELKGWKGSRFVLDIGSGKARMELRISYVWRQRLFAVRRECRNSEC